MANASNLPDQAAQMIANYKGEWLAAWADGDCDEEERGRLEGMIDELYLTLEVMAVALGFSRQVETIGLEAPNKHLWRRIHELHEFAQAMRDGRAQESPLQVEATEGQEAA